MVILVIFRFREYFGLFLDFRGILDIFMFLGVLLFFFLDLGDILVIFFFFFLV